MSKEFILDQSSRPETPRRRSVTATLRDWRPWLLAGVCAFVYAPVLNNGFIADDYAYLEWSARLKSDFWFLFTIPPNNFRMTSFLVFAALKDIVGYRPSMFYVFAILLHFVNCLLLWRLISTLWKDHRTAYLAALLFAVFHAPQEAVLWLAAMGETLTAFCLLAAVLLWMKERYLLSVCLYAAGLFSKESAVIMLALIPLIQWQRGKRLFPPQYFLFLIPSGLFAGVFVWTWSTNSYIKLGVYDTNVNVVEVFVRTLNRLLWPWFYIVLAAYRLNTKRWPDWRSAVRFLLWIPVPMLPYLFLTYQRALPSRHVYLASMILAAGMAFLLGQLPSSAFRRLFLAAFLAFNVGYLWIRKDAQFEGRARPTTELLRLLRSHSPTQILVFDFPYLPNVGKAVAWLAPGWTTDLLGVHGTGETCSDCVILRWDPASQKYLGPW